MGDVWSGILTDAIGYGAALLSDLGVVVAFLAGLAFLGLLAAIIRKVVS